MILRFTEDQLQLFSRASHDVNALHMDESYARRTQFGKRVVFGVASLLAAIGSWANGRRLRLKHVKADFKQPLFLDEDYLLEVVEKDQVATLTIKKGSLTKSKFKIEWAEWETSEDGVFNSPPKLSDDYSADPKNVWALASSFGLNSDQVPFSQVQTMLWSSFYVGMKAPGEQALFTSLEINYSEVVAPPGPMSLEDLTVKKDERFHEVKITAKASGAQVLSLSAFERPLPVTYDDLSRLHSGVSFRGKTVLITGANRGFGLVLAQAFVISGAKLVLQVRSDASKVAKFGDVIAADLASTAGLDHLLTEVRETEFDIVVSNAFPPPPVLKSSETSSGEVVEYLAKSFFVGVEPLRRFTPKMKKHGLLVAISSIFMSEAEPKFFAYTTAKGAMEGAVRSLASENSQLNFLIYRPQRMLTDSTNVVFDHLRPPSPVDAANHLLRELMDFGSTGNFKVVEQVAHA